MKTFALASCSLFFVALVSGCPPPANTGEGEGEGQAAGEGEGQTAGEGEGEGEGAGEGEGEGAEGEGEGEGGADVPVTVVVGTDAVATGTFTNDVDFICYTFTTDQRAVFTVTTSGSCAGANGVPETDVDVSDLNDDFDFNDTGSSSPVANCASATGVIDAGLDVFACVSAGNFDNGTFTVTIHEEAITTVSDGDPCDPNNIAQVCDTTTSSNEACLVDENGNTVCASPTTVGAGTTCIPTQTTVTCDSTAGLACLDDGSGSNFTCQSPDAVRCAQPVDFGSSPGGASLFVGTATNRNSAENTCGFEDGNDLVLQYTIQGDNSLVTFEALGVKSIAVRTTCADATTESSCETGDGSKVSGQGANGAVLFVLIDADPAAGEVVVQATEQPVLAGGDTCDAAVALPAASGSVASSSVTGFTDTIDLGDGNPCTNFSTAGFDQFYSITIPAGQTLNAAMDPNGFDAALYVIDQCPFSPATDIGHCLVGSDGGGTENVTFKNTTGADEDVLIVTDSDFADETGSFTLTWSLQ